jgi:amidase
MKSYLFILSFLIVFSCKNSETVKEEVLPTSIETIVDSVETKVDSIKDLREFKVLDSKYINVEDLWSPFNKDLEDFSEDTYNRLKPLIFEQDIPTLQKVISERKLSYENLVKFYLYRIRKFDRANDLSLNSIIALNPNIISEAKQKDKELLNRMAKRPLFGMPILLKDNINTSGMPTTAGAVALQNNINTEDAFIVKQLKQQGALVLGKANLSEWANYFSENSSNGYSAIGGQTFNPYGRRTIDTGGSSSGSGVAVAANFCVAAVGSETSGSILSPSSKNSVVGLKPTIGLLSRSGIVPISSTLDTPGPITKNVIDNAIMLDAMFGQDKADEKSIYAIWESGFYSEDIKVNDLKGRRFGALKDLMQDTLYVNAIAILKQNGAEIIEIEKEKVELTDFKRLLNLDMKNDLPMYLSTWTDSLVTINSVQDVVEFNKKDSLNRMPYGQIIFEGIVADSATVEEFEAIKVNLKSLGRQYFDSSMDEYQLDGILSINNYHAGFAAVAEYPALTVPMGYTEKGVPEGLTFIGRPLQEKFLLQWAYVYEQASKMRKTPKNYN